ncbi:hypothetical protein JCM17478_36930 [Thermopirellula anaerolimosa]
MHQRPSNALVLVLPENQSPAGFAAFQILAGVRGDVGVLMPRVQDADQGHSHPGNTGPVGDGIGRDRFQEDSELAPMGPRLRYYAVERELILKALLILVGTDDRPIKAQHLESQPVAAASIANLDDRAMGKARVGVLSLVALPVLEIQSGVDERIESLGGDLQRLPGLDFFERVSHRNPSAYGPMPNSPKSPYG